MQFADLRLLAREPRGRRVRQDVLQSLGLPRPWDVLDQWLYDHGLKEAFQIQYGHLDLYALGWACVSLPAEELIEASAFRGFDRHEDIAHRIAHVPRRGWCTVQLPQGATRAWRTEGTWLRPPVMLDGDLVESEADLHLVEGHTRLGALTGLVRAGLVEPSSQHLVWVGRPTPSAGRAPPIPEEDRVDLLHWLLDHQVRMDIVGDLATWLAHFPPPASDVPSLTAHVEHHRPDALSGLEDALQMWTAGLARLDTATGR